jgi:hypothetical protein
MKPLFYLLCLTSVSTFAASPTGIQLGPRLISQALVELGCGPFEEFYQRNWRTSPAAFSTAGFGNSRSPQVWAAWCIRDSSQSIVFGSLDASFEFPCGSETPPLPDFYLGGISLGYSEATRFSLEGWRVLDASEDFIELDLAPIGYYVRGEVEGLAYTLVCQDETWFVKWYD